MLFAGLYADPASVARAFLAAALFSVGASAAYVFNDLQDLESDRRHPVKRDTRPLAAGTVTTKQAMLLLAVLVAILVVALPLWPRVVGIIALYMAVSVAYSVKLKHVPVVDLFALATGFVLRVWAGAVAIDVPLSLWMLITTLCLSLYLAAIKRRQELARSGAGARSVLGAYSLVLLDRYAEMSAVGAILFYSLYVIEVRPELGVTVPLVLFGLFRYWYIVEARQEGESPTAALYTDVPLALTILLWVAAAVVALTLA